MIRFDIALNDGRVCEVVTDAFSPLANILEHTPIVVGYKAYNGTARYLPTHYAGCTKLCDRWPWERVSRDVAVEEVVSTLDDGHERLRP